MHRSREPLLAWRRSVQEDELKNLTRSRISIDYAEEFCNVLFKNTQDSCGTSSSKAETQFSHPLDELKACSRKLHSTLDKLG